MVFVGGDVTHQFLLYYCARTDGFDAELLVCKAEDIRMIGAMGEGKALFGLEFFGMQATYQVVDIVAGGGNEEVDFHLANLLFLEVFKQGGVSVDDVDAIIQFTFNFLSMYLVTFEHPHLVVPGLHFLCQGETVTATADYNDSWFPVFHVACMQFIGGFRERLRAATESDAVSFLEVIIGPGNKGRSAALAEDGQYACPFRQRDLPQRSIASLTPPGNDDLLHLNFPQPDLLDFV